MPSKRIRKRLARDAAKLLYEGQEKGLSEARRRAVRDSGLPDRVARRNLPTDREVLECVDALTLEREGENRPANPREAHLSALKLLWRLSDLRPRVRLDSAAATGPEAPILIELQSEDQTAVRRLLDELGAAYVSEGPPFGAVAAYRFQMRTARQSQLTVRLIIGPVADLSRDPPAESRELTMTTPDFENFVRETYPDADLDELREGDETWADPYVIFSLLLGRLEGVKQKPEHHPEGDALYHSLQAFDLAREQFPYDEEFLQAALLHDVGKGINPTRHVDSGLEALRGLISPRTEFLIRHHAAARKLKEGTLNGRLRDELMSSEWLDDLMALHAIDDAARKAGVAASTVEEAVAYLRSLGDW